MRDSRTPRGNFAYKKRLIIVCRGAPPKARLSDAHSSLFRHSVPFTCPKNKEHPVWVLLFLNGLFRNSRSHAKLFFTFGHAHAYLSAFAYLVPKKRYQRFSYFVIHINANQLNNIPRYAVNASKRSLFFALSKQTERYVLIKGSVPEGLTIILLPSSSSNDNTFALGNFNFVCVK